MKPDLKKLVILNLPYLLFVWLFGKMGEAWRLAAGADASPKMLHFMDSLAAAFANGLPGFYPFDLNQIFLTARKFVISRNLQSYEQVSCMIPCIKNLRT